MKKHLILPKLILTIPYNSYLLLKCIMEKIEEVKRAIGSKPYEVLVEAIDKGSITKTVLKKMAIKMGVHGVFMSYQNERDVLDIFGPMMDRWYVNTLRKEGVKGFDLLINILEDDSVRQGELAQKMKQNTEPTDCEHCGNEMKGKDKSRLFCLCCSSHRVTTLENSGELATSLLAQFKMQEMMRKSEEFLKDEYKHLDGFQKHPEIFIPGLVKPGGEEIYNLINEEFKDDTCMVLHNYRPGISREVALDIWDQEEVKTSLENMEKLRRLALIDDEIATDNVKEEQEKPQRRH